jgi:hypothetical protein
MSFLLTAGIDWSDKHPALMLAGALACAGIGSYLLRVVA